MAPHLLNLVGGVRDWRMVLLLAAAFAALAIGPALGVVAMVALRRSPAAARLAGGRG